MVRMKKRQVRAGILLCMFTVLGTSAAQADNAGAPAYAVLERIPGPDGGWDYTTIDAGARRLYLGRDPGVLTMDLETRKITPVAVPGEGVHGATPVGDTGLVVSTNGDKNTVTIFAGQTNKVVGSVKVGNSPDASAYDPSTKLVAVMNHRGGTVSLIDASKPAVVKTIPVGGELEAAAASGDGQLFVNVANKHEIAVLDLAAGKVVRRMVMTGCEDPSGLAYDAADGLLASVCSNGVTKILHAADGKEVASLKTGLGSDGLIFDPSRKLLFVPAGKSGTLTVIGLGADKTPEVLQTVKTASGARLGALDAKTGRLYLPSAKLGPPVPPDPWPTVVPGTFALLVVGER
jgi:DNA-binding beta-propeller fold protein YncE